MEYASVHILETSAQQILIAVRTIALMEPVSALQMRVPANKIQIAAPIFVALMGLVLAKGI